MTDIEAIEAGLAARWDREQLAVYGDALRRRGDPRGELIAIDLQVQQHGPDEQLAARKRQLIDAWLGADVAARVLERGTVDCGFIDMRWPIPAEALDALLAAPAVARYVRTLWVEEDNAGIRRVFDRLCETPRPWLDHVEMSNYRATEEEVESGEAAVDGERAEAFVAVTPHLRSMVLAGSKVVGELVHPNLRELVLYNHDAYGSIHRPGPPFPALTTIDLQFFFPPSGPELEALLPPARLPALRRLDISRNERHRDLAFELAKRHPVVSQLAWLRTPALRSDAQLEAAEAARSRMPRDAELVVARAYVGCISRSPSDGITMPSPRPWPPHDTIGATDALLVSIPGDPYSDRVRLCEVIRLLEGMPDASVGPFDRFAEPVRDAWRHVWQLVTALGPSRSAPSSLTALPFSAEVLARALEPLDLRMSLRAWEDLRAALRRRTADTLIRRSSSFLA